MLQPLVSVDLSNESFPFGTSREIELGYAMVRASRITYVGELGWELYIPSDMVLHVYETLTSTPLVHVGMHAVNSLRMEKGYRHWGHDITDEETPLEGGLGFAIAWDKPGGFIGRDALLEQKAGGLNKRLVQFQLNDPEPLLYHNEPIFREGEIVGYMTSGMYGHHLGGAIGLGYVHDDGGVDAAYVNEGAFEVLVAGEMVAASASLRPLYDPKSERIKA